MSQLAAQQAWAAILVVALMVAGASLAGLGSIGLLRPQDFYQRVHAPHREPRWGRTACWQRR